MSQDDYLGPQRGRTLLGELPYQYPKPTKEFRTLALTPQHRDETPAGNQHLRYENATSNPQRQAVALWDLVDVDSEAVTAKVNLGTILKSLEDLSDHFTITNGTNAFAMTAGHVLRLKFTGTYASTTVTLEGGSTWTDHPAGYETTSSGASAAYAAYYYPLWEFFSTTVTGASLVATGLYARKVAPPTNFLRTASVYHKTGDRPFAVRILVPYHRASD